MSIAHITKNIFTLNDNKNPHCKKDITQLLRGAEIKTRANSLPVFKNRNSRLPAVKHHPVGHHPA